MPAKGRDEYNDQSVPAVLSRFATQIDTLIDGQTRIETKLDTQFQTKEQAANDRRDAAEGLARLETTMNQGFKRISDLDQARVESRARWTNAFLSAGAVVAVAALVALLKLVLPSL